MGNLNCGHCGAIGSVKIDMSIGTQGISTCETCLRHCNPAAIAQAEHELSFAAIANNVARALFMNHPHIKNVRSRMHELPNAKFYPKAWDTENEVRTECLSEARTLACRMIEAQIDGGWWGEQTCPRAEQIVKRWPGM